MKGPAIAARLYEDSERVYTDVDLLVSQDSGAATSGALAALGFTRPYAGRRCRGHSDQPAA